ncbi:MAG: chromatin organization modifier chromo domain protein [Hyperionvirus sp.]|uniref:Chromatin organization modifier chromo domain protein n=1 Tax=Hyperionvirus sp. TaxID=2487770 RepID=A0A3G5A6R7_9VIRU|nr:MAG: chromatin organization modifier chromo domain protein [Hyperionvirus sp.]
MAAATRSKAQRKRKSSEEPHGHLDQKCRQDSDEKAPEEASAPQGTYDDRDSPNKALINEQNAKHQKAVMTLNPGNYGGSIALDGEHLRTSDACLLHSGLNPSLFKVVEHNRETFDKMHFIGSEHKISPHIIYGELVDVIQRDSEPLSFGFFDYLHTKMTLNDKSCMRRFFDRATKFAVLCITHSLRIGWRRTTHKLTAAIHLRHISRIAKDANVEIHTRHSFYRRELNGCAMVYYEIFIGPWKKLPAPIIFPSSETDEAPAASFIVEKQSVAAKTFYQRCELCDYDAGTKSHWIHHIAGKKHQRRTGIDPDEALQPIIKGGLCYCPICEKFVKCEQNFRMHLLTKSHQRAAAE